MHADLMGAARVQTEAQQAAAAAGFQHAVIRARGLSVRTYLAPDGRAVRLADRQVNHALIPGRRAFDHGQVFPDEFRPVQKTLQKVLRMRRARSQHQPAGAFVQAVHGPVHKAFGTTRVGVEGIFQRGALFFLRTGGGKRRGLVDHPEMRVLIRDAQGKRKGFGQGCGGFGHIHGQAFAGMYAPVRQHGRAIHHQRAVELGALELPAAQSQAAHGRLAHRAPIQRRRDDQLVARHTSASFFISGRYAEA